MLGMETMDEVREAMKDLRESAWTYCRSGSI